MHADQRWRAEMESAWLYRVVAAVEADAARRATFEQLAVRDEEQATSYLDGPAPAFAPTRRREQEEEIEKDVGAEAPPVESGTGKERIISRHR